MKVTRVSCNRGHVQIKLKDLAFYITHNVDEQLDKPSLHFEIIEEMCNFRDGARKTNFDAKSEFKFSARFEKYFVAINTSKILLFLA